MAAKRVTRGYIARRAEFAELVGNIERALGAELGEIQSSFDEAARFVDAEYDTEIGKAAAQFAEKSESLCGARAGRTRFGPNRERLRAQVASLASAMEARVRAVEGQRAVEHRNLRELLARANASSSLAADAAIERARASLGL
jgi:hypothetical protein